jgi:hypothetical protein
MLLKKENKQLFINNYSIEKLSKRSVSSSNKKSLLRIPSSNKLPKDFFKLNESVPNLNKRYSQ